MKRLVSLMLVAALGSWSGSALSDSGSAFGDEVRGKELFGRMCSACHGYNGRGKGGMAPDFNKEWSRLSQSDEQLADHIRNNYSSGKGFYDAGSCPPHRISDRKMEDLLAYLHKLSRSNTGVMDADEFFNGERDDFFGRGRDGFR